MANYEFARRSWVKLTIGALIATGMTLAPPAGIAAAAPGTNQGDNGSHGQGNSGDNGNHGQGNNGHDPGGGGSGPGGGGDSGGGDPSAPGDPQDPADPDAVAASSDILPCAPDLAVQTPCLEAPSL